MNRTEVPDASRAAIRNRMGAPPRRTPLGETFAQHLASDAKVLDEDEEKGIRKYRYVRVGEDHFSLVFTYAWMGASDPGLVDWRTFWSGIRLGKWPAIR